MNKFFAGLGLSALVVVGGALAYLTNQVPEGLRGPVAVLLVLGLIFGPLVAYVACKVYGYKTAQLGRPQAPRRYEPARWEQSAKPRRTHLEVIEHGERGGQRAL